MLIKRNPKISFPSCSADLDNSKGIGSRIGKGQSSDMDESSLTPCTCPEARKPTTVFAMDGFSATQRILPIVQP